MAVFRSLTKKQVVFILIQKYKGGKHECLMDCQYEYVFVNPFDYYGFLPYHTGECVDPLAEKGVRFDCRFRIAECGIKDPH
jgi:hypothetical protein